MVEFVFNDGGREAAGFKGLTGDCGLRALAIATGRPYKDIYDILQECKKGERARKHRGKVSQKSSMRNGIYLPTFKKMVSRIGGFEWTPCMGIGTGCKVHLCADELPSGVLILRLSRHCAAMIDGVLHDTYDSSREGTRCVYGYWKKVA